MLLCGSTTAQRVDAIRLQGNFFLTVPAGIGLLPAKEEQSWSLYRPASLPEVYRDEYYTQVDPESWESSELSSLLDLPAELTPEEVAALENASVTGVALPGLQELGESEITGEIYDFATIEPLGDVSVTVKGRLESELTGPDGTFTITGLPAGRYSLEFSKLGYSIGSAKAITRQGFPGTVRLGLRVKAVDGEDSEVLLDEEPVIGEITESGSGDFNLDIKSESSVSSGLSQEEFSAAGVSDAADAVSKISGANIVGGKFAVVRGLGDRYSNTTLNGALIPSADPSRKAVQLDLFPADLLSSVQIYKTARPDLSAEFTGGLVELKTLSHHSAFSF